ncbi:LytS/YhcK type 5TM receptor domain-containing protein, partial [Virgibacillus sp. DJP39]|uniref:LytS/YhcK type 5TM receptor domain-containing protein n=1 Tax=Virgibacillus sp. DJP39 TaxID=3409790 RepID=UPI003BB73546
MLQILLSNLAIILIAYLSKEFIYKKLTHFPKLFLIGFNIVLYSSLIILLFYIPIQINDFRFDLRVVILLFLAITYGWRITVSILIITALWRLSVIGGSVALASVFYNMIIPVLIGLLFRQANYKIMPFRNLFILASSVWLITLIPLTWLDPNGFEMLKSIAITHYLTFIICFLILYGLYAGTVKQEEMEEKVHHMAYHDALTGLPNRYNLMNEL